MSINTLEAMVQMVIWINQLWLREQSHDRTMQQNFRMRANRNCKLKHTKYKPPKKSLTHISYLSTFALCTLVCLSFPIQNNFFRNVMLLDTAMWLACLNCGEGFSIFLLFCALIKLCLLKSLLQIVSCVPSGCAFVLFIPL